MRVNNPAAPSPLNTISMPGQLRRGRGISWFDDFSRLTLVIGAAPITYNSAAGPNSSVAIDETRRLKMGYTSNSGVREYSVIQTVLSAWKMGYEPNRFAPISKISAYFDGVVLGSASSHAWYGLAGPNAAAVQEGNQSLIIDHENNANGEQFLELVWRDPDGENVEADIATIEAGASLNVELDFDGAVATARVQRYTGGQTYTAKINVPDKALGGLALSARVGHVIEDAAMYMDEWGVKYE